MITASATVVLTPSPLKVGGSACGCGALTTGTRLAGPPGTLPVRVIRAPSLRTHTTLQLSQLGVMA